VPGLGREQAQHRQPEQETVRWRALSQGERGPQRVPLGLGQAGRAAQHRPAQLMQPGKHEFHLRLHARRPSQPASRTASLPGQVLQQHGLADAGVTADDQDRAVSGPDRFDHVIERLALGAAAGQPVHACALDSPRRQGVGLTCPPSTSVRSSSDPA
jgi:hypothetical protein